MIIRMRRGANRIMAEHVAAVFQREGIAVFVKNGDGIFTFAALGEKAMRVCRGFVSGLAGIEYFSDNDSLFTGRRSEFLSADEYFRD